MIEFLANEAADPKTSIHFCIHVSWPRLLNRRIDLCVPFETKKIFEFTS